MKQPWPHTVESAQLGVLTPFSAKALYPGGFSLTTLEMCHFAFGAKAQVTIELIEGVKRQQSVNSWELSKSPQEPLLGRTVCGGP